MAAKSFINKLDIDVFKVHFKDSLQQMHVDGQNWFWLVQRVSFHLENYLLQKLQGLPERDNVQIVSLGSWSRSELCPKSDIDVILVGEDQSIIKMVRAAEEKSIFLKYRKPADINDWTVGVEPFDLLALTKSRAVDLSIKPKLEEQKKLLQKKMLENDLPLKWLEIMHNERASRNERYESLANYLQPNLKYGPGALRDAEQTSVVLKLFADKFINFKKEISLFENNKSFLLLVRYLLHLNGASDLLEAQVSLSISKALGFTTLKEFNSHVQIKLHEIHFFTQLVRDMIISGQELPYTKTSSLQDCLLNLIKDPTILRQNQTRNIIKSIKVSTDDKIFFSKQFQTIKSEQKMLALYQSDMLFKFFPNLKRCHGHVQYDHYHRYTVDAHTVQALRIYCKCLSSSNDILLANADWFHELTDKELKILLWALLYHDQAKGLKGSHSELGAQIAIEELSDFGLSQEFITEVSWLVKNHLILSEAAFRKNPEDLSTWEWVHGHGSNERRVYLLACLTAIDIIATNPDAWTPWKSNLLHRLVHHILSPEATQFLELAKIIGDTSTMEKRSEFLSELAPMLLGQVKSSIIAKDFIELTNHQRNSDLPVLFTEGEDGYKWVRFHSREDSSGLFLDWCKTMTALSCSVREAYIHTFFSLGAYDWIKIKTNKSTQVLTKQLNYIDIDSVKMNSVKFDSINVIDKPGKDEWIVKFKGADQDGALLAAVSKIKDNNMEIIWARVHTWGDILEDVFALKGTDSDIEKLFEL